MSPERVIGLADHVLGVEGNYEGHAVSCVDLLLGGARSRRLRGFRPDGPPLVNGFG